MSGTDRSFGVRESSEADVPAISRIYGHWVRHGLGTFEYDPPAEAEIARRRAALVAAGFPFFVAEYGGKIVGYASAGPYRPRPGYRFTCEDSIYVAPDAARKGLGRALLSAVITRSEADGFRLMLAVIGDSGNTSSLGLHAALGFTHAGTLRNVGWKHGRWIDTVFMMRELGQGSTTAPSEAGDRR